MDREQKGFLIAVSILIGACIGAGVLGIPYVAAQAGFLVALSYIIGVGLIVLLVNLYLGEVSLRTKGNHQLVGYAEMYLGKKGRFFMAFATIFLLYAALVAYMLGVGESISYLIFGGSNYTIFFGLGYGLFMAGLIWRGMKGLKRFEKIGVSIVLFLLFLIFVFFIKDVRFANLSGINFENIFLPFGVILFALLSFHAIPEVEIVLHGREKLMKKVIVYATLVSIVFYSVFAFIVVGFKGADTPEIATITLGSIFILLGIFTMFTSYLALGNALFENFMFDEKMKKKKSWFLSAIVPIGIFLFIKVFGLLSFTKILSVGGVVAGGILGVLVLLMVKTSKEKGNRKPEYSLPINWFIIGFLSLVFILGIVYELMRYI